MTIMDRLSIALGMPPELVLVGLFLLFIVVVGFSMFAREQSRGTRRMDWRRDPDELEDLSPSLQRARFQMIAAAIAMIAIFTILIFSVI